MARHYSKKYPTKESRAGHKYNMSAKHRKAESKGMSHYNDDMHEKADSQMYHKGKEYYGMGYGHVANLPQMHHQHAYPAPYAHLKEDYPDTIEEIDHDLINSFEKAAAYPSDSMY